MTQREAFAGWDRLQCGRRDAATGAAVRPPALAVVRQDNVDHDLFSVMLRIVTLMSLSSSPVCGWAVGDLGSRVRHHVSRQ